MKLDTTKLLFDEFDVKEHSTTETLKQGKKEFQKNTIKNVSLGANSLSGTYTKGRTEKKIKITKQNTKLIGMIDNDEIKPFSAPLTALAYWYIDYINKNKSFSTKPTTANNNFEPYNKIQLTFLYNFNQNKINLTLYHPSIDTFCDESHLFIHSLNNLIEHFNPSSQTIIKGIQQHFDETFFYHSSWQKKDDYLATCIIKLIKNKTLYDKDHQIIEPSEEKVILKITCKIIDHQLLISFIWTCKNKKTLIPVTEALQCNKSNIIVYENKCYEVENYAHTKIADQFNSHSLQRLNISKIKPFITKLVTLRKKIGIELAIDKNIQNLKEISISPICEIEIETTSEGGILQIGYKYNDIKVLSSSPTPYIIFPDFTYTQRDQKKEHDLRDILLHYHPVSTDIDSITYKSPFFDQIIGEIKNKTYEDIKFGPNSNTKFLLNKTNIEATLQVKQNAQSEIKVSVTWNHPNNDNISTKIKEYIQYEIPYYFDKKLNQIIPIEQSPLLSNIYKNETIKISLGIIIYLALNTDFKMELNKDIEKKVKELQKINAIPIDTKIKKILRPFQKDGLQWLLSLHNSNINGILADDMGLGKTIQSIMLLRSIYYENNHLSPSIIIMPKTLLFNWERELRTFAPNLNVLCYDGPKRKKLIEDFKNYDIILSSYASIRLDEKLLNKEPFNYMILDEAQYVKNHTTNTFKAIKKIKSTHTLLLTGTPVENSISDLWSLMDIANDNFFGNYKSYEELYSDEKNIPLLKASIQPLMLRRRKNEVLKDLPPVTIQELWATPSPEEIKAYTTFANQEWQNIESIVKKKGIEKSKLHIFSLMTKLRQWCAHPKLISDTEEDGPKWLIFFDRLEEAISNGHKVVVFSQFIPMIETMEKKLEENNIQFISLTGQTKNRETVIETFNNNPDIRIGLFSLKAGGVGINLTSADYVFLYDPWWNPAVEQQAIDRVHRMGQESPVMVFKCLVASTIEERMIIYQEQKKQLIDSLIEEQSIKNLKIEEIKDLIGI